MLATARPTRAWPGPPSPRRLSLFNAHTRESFDGPYRDEHGPIADAMHELSHFLRDFHSGEVAAEIVAPSLRDGIAEKHQRVLILLDALCPGNAAFKP